jgi:hypothetical protein
MKHSAAESKLKKRMVPVFLCVYGCTEYPALESGFLKSGSRPDDTGTGFDVPDTGTPTVY